MFTIDDLKKFSSGDRIHVFDTTKPGSARGRGFTATVVRVNSISLSVKWDHNGRDGKVRCGSLRPDGRWGIRVEKLAPGGQS